jgi:demethylmenaquinone methyltransferase/2-methoxy-6-polyprenyl-1,4-benzoquinol methylase
MTLKSRMYDLVVSKSYDAELEEVTLAARKRCIEKLQLHPGATVLDLGCGTGLNLPHIVQALGTQGRVVAVDASQKMLEQAAERLRREGIEDRVTLVQGDARKLDELLAPVLQGARLDAVLITLFFSVVPAWRDVFAKAFDRLAPGGRCAIMDTYWPKPSRRLLFLSWRYAADPTRPGFEPLQQASADFQMENFPPDNSEAFYIAVGTK